MKTTKITAPDGSVTTMKTKSTCGCLTVLAFAVVVFGPAAWFPLWGAILAYVGLGVGIVAIGWIGVAENKKKQAAASAPPPIPPEPPPLTTA
jgi:hypothetical protein